MSLGLEVKQLQDLIGADDNSIIGWELHKIYPAGVHLRRVVEFVDSHQPSPIPRDIMWKLCFSENPCYPKEIRTLGDKIRATRMQNFLSIKQLAQKFGVNESTVAKWELKGSQPRPDMLERIQEFLAAHRSEPPE